MAVKKTDNKKTKTVPKKAPVKSIDKNRPKKVGDDRKLGLYANLSRDNPKHAKVWRFIDEYCIDSNATQAAIRAGYAKNSAQQQSSDLLLNPFVKQEIEKKKAEIAERNGIDQDYVLQKFKKVAEAKASSLSQVHVNCCRHCWHPEFLYQFTPHEFRLAMQEHEENEANKALINKEYNEKPFDQQGGATFRKNLKPNPECVECCGEGITRIVLADTRDLSDDELFLFDGAEFSKDGMKVKHLSREGALDKLAKHTGFYEKDNEIKVDIFDSEKLEQKFCKKIDKSNQRQADIEKERGLPPRNQ